MLSLLALVTTALAVDADGDGFGVEDCNDENAAVFPGAVEVCEPSGSPQVDNDCDGNVNTRDGEYAMSVDSLFPNMSAVPYYPDNDGDGFSDMFATSTYYLCAPARLGDPLRPGGEDCDDTNAQVHPYADELCNGIDENCNGIVDDIAVDGGPSAGSAEVFRDEDEDGFGVAFELPRYMCTGFITASTTNFDGNEFDYLWGHYSLSDGDCDDFDEHRFPRPPGYVEELDGRDNDCDGHVSLYELDCDGDRSCPIVPDGDCSDFLPGPAATCGDVDLVVACSPESGTWLVSTEQLPDLYDWGRRFRALGCSDDTDDCDDNDAGRSPHADEVCDGFDTSCVGSEGLDVDANADGVSDALQGGIAGRTNEQLLDTDDDGVLDACDDFGPERIVTGSGPEYPAPSNEPDADDEPVDESDQPGGCSCGTMPVSPVWGVFGLALLALGAHRRRR